MGKFVLYAFLLGIFMTGNQLLARDPNMDVNVATCTKTYGDPGYPFKLTISRKIPARSPADTVFQIGDSKYHYWGNGAFSNPDDHWIDFLYVGVPDTLIDGQSGTFLSPFNIMEGPDGEITRKLLVSGMQNYTCIVGPVGFIENPP